MIFFVSFALILANLVISAFPDKAKIDMNKNSDLVNELIRKILNRSLAKINYYIKILSQALLMMN